MKTPGRLFLLLGIALTGLVGPLIWAAAGLAAPIIVFNADGDGQIKTYNYANGQMIGSFTPTGTTNGRGVEVVGNTIFYTACASSPPGAIFYAPFNNGAGGPATGSLPNPRPGFVIQDLDCSNGKLYALTGYLGSPSSPLIVYALNPSNGQVIGAPVTIQNHSNSNSDGFTILPNGDFLINDDDGSPVYRGYSSTTGIATGLVITVSTPKSMGVDYDPADCLLYFSNGQRTTLGGVLVSSTAGMAGYEDISIIDASGVGSSSGACCLPNGNCEYVTADSCLTVRGVYRGDGVSCASEACLGACCLPNGLCYIESQASCTALGGFFHGSGTSCNPNPCVGACCLPHGVCESISADSCSTAGGIYHGDGSSCTPNPCPDCSATPDFPLPSCLASWYPFEDPINGGWQVPTAADVLAGRTLSWQGGPNWIDLGPCQQNASANLSGPSVQYLQAAASWPQHSFGTGSFSIFAWVNVSASNISDGLVHTLVDKRVWNAVGSRLTGYLLYLYQGRVYLQLGANDHWSTYPGPVPPLNAGAWHMVGASVCRNGSTFEASVSVDGLPVNSFSPAEYGNLDNSVALRVGEQSPGFTTGTPFSGFVAQLQLFPCCLSPAQVTALFQNCGPCTGQTCYVPSVVTNDSSQPKVSTTFLVWNYGPAATYDWYISGYPDPACGSLVPVTFSQNTGSVSLGAGPSWQPVTVQITYPPGFTTSDAGCYQVTIRNRTSGCCTQRTGMIRRYPWRLDPVGTLLPASLGAPVMIRYLLRNVNDLPQTIGYQLVGSSSDGDATNQVVSLNGLPPGTPVTGTATLAPGDSTILQVQAVLTAYQPLNVNEVVLSVDWTGGGNYSSAAAIGLESLTDDQVSSVPSAPPPAVPVEITPALSAAPNPFSARTAIQFTLASAQSAVRVGVFDVSGRLVREVFSGSLAAGSHEYQWDGRDGQGVKSGAGIYFICVRAPGVQLTTRVVRVE